MTYNLTVLLHHIVQFRNEIRIAPITVEHIMLQASGLINVPECLTRKVLHLTPVLFLF